MTGKEKLDKAAKYAKSLLNIGYDIITVERMVENYMEELDAMEVTYDEWLDPYPILETDGIM